jgi:hypothetical protein
MFSYPKLKQTCCGTERCTPFARCGVGWVLWVGRIWFSVNPSECLKLNRKGTCSSAWETDSAVASSGVWLYSLCRLYVEKLLDALESALCMNLDRVHVTGFSNGGMFTCVDLLSRNVLC